MIKNLLLLFVSILLIGFSAFASDLELEEIKSIKVTHQNQSQYNIEVNMSLPADIEGKAVDTTERRVDLKVPKKINGSELDLIHISLTKYKRPRSPFLSTRIAFENDSKDVNAVSSYFYINIETINYTQLIVSYSKPNSVYVIDLKSYIKKR
jgi:hypothetical protein